MSPLTLPTAARQVLPHREPMLVLDELADYSDGFVRATVLIAADNPFVDESGEVEPVVLIEMLAQGAAALKGYEAREKGKLAAVGYLAGIKALTINKGARASQPLCVEVRQTFALEPAAIMEGRVWERIPAGDFTGKMPAPQADLVSGTVKVWEEPGGSLPHPRDTGLQAAEECGTGFPAGVFTGKMAAPHDGRNAMHRALLASAVRLGPPPAKHGLKTHAALAETVGEFSFGESFPGFRGHFPDRPILPGILMVKMALILCERLLDQPVDLTRIERAKFVGAVFPGQLVRVEVRMSPASPEGQVCDPCSPPLKRWATRNTDWLVRATLTCKDVRIAAFSFAVRRNVT